MALNDVWRLNLIGTYLGQAHQNVLHFLNVNQVGTDVTPAGIIARWGGLFEAQYMGILSDQYTFTGYDIQRVYPALSDPVSAPPTTAGLGLVAGDPCPSYVAQVTSLRTGVASRRARGRIYIGAQSEVNVNANVVATAYLNDVIAWITAMMTEWVVTQGGNTTTLTLCVFSRTDNIGREVQQIIARSAPATMRSRKLGRGI